MDQKRPVHTSVNQRRNLSKLHMDSFWIFCLSISKIQVVLDAYQDCTTTRGPTSRSGFIIRISQGACGGSEAVPWGQTKVLAYCLPFDAATCVQIKLKMRFWGKSGLNSAKVVSKPASRTLVTIVASISGVYPSIRLDPFIMGTPDTGMLSLTAIFFPWRIPDGAPWMSVL